MAEAAAAPGEVNFLLANAAIAACGDRHGGERFVDLPQRHVADRKTGALQHFTDELSVYITGGRQITTNLGTWRVGGFVGRTDIAALLALAAALMMGIGDVIQQRSAHDVTQKPVGTLALFRRLLHDLRWWAGSLVAGAGFGLQAAALGLAPWCSCRHCW